MVETRNASQTRAKIAAAAVQVFAERGYEGATTRQIAAAAGVNQGLITYYFQSKERLWKEAVSGMFGEARAMLEEAEAAAEGHTRTAGNRARIHAMVRFFAERPHIARLMIQEGKQASDRMRWLVDHWLSGLYASISFLSEDPERRAHEFYALTGAATLIFAVPDECERLTGCSPRTDAAIRAHADLIADLFA